MLGRRELSEKQIRDRLKRKQYSEDDIDGAVARLREEHAIDDDGLIEASLQKRLRGRDTIADDREFQRLYRFLAGQGFESDKIVKVLRAHRQKATTQRRTQDTDD